MDVGIDIVYIKRIKLTDKFIDFVLSENEKKILITRTKKEEFLAGRFAAKEAFLKAHEKGIGEIPLKEIEVLSKDNGAPYISYKGKNYHKVSISHDEDYAIAIVNL